MATLEDAAEQLVVKLKGLDSEIEESQHSLEELRGRVETSSNEVDEEWSALTEAVTSLLEKLREEQEQLAGEAREALQAAAQARGAVHESAAEARSEIGEGRADLEALSQHAARLEPSVESLVAEAGEAPAQSLAERAQEVEQELARVLEEAREFLQDEVVTSLDRLAEDVRDRCQALRATLVEEGAAALQEAFDEWESGIDELEDYVAAQGFVVSHSHAHAVVGWALDECQTACEAHLEALNALFEETARPLQELATELQRAGDILAGRGTDLISALDGTRESATPGVSALDAVKDLLASFSFMRI